MSERPTRPRFWLVLWLIDLLGKHVDKKARNHLTAIERLQFELSVEHQQERADLTISKRFCGAVSDIVLFNLSQ